MLDPFYPVLESAGWIERLLPCGVRLVQLRVKDQPAAVVHSEIARAKALCAAAGARLVVNDYWRAAIDLGCDYVHLGQEDLDTADLAAIREAGVKLGISTHDDAELERALAAGPDYIALGPIYPTRLKAMRFAPQGLDKIATWKQRIGTIPLVAIGGISLERAAGVLEAGADVAAVVTDITLDANPEVRAVKWLEQTRASQIEAETVSSFQNEGFCSLESKRSICQIRDRSKVWFDHCTTINRSLHNMVYEAGVIRDVFFSKKVVTAAIFLRSVGSFQGVINLTERGMHLSAYALVRSILEDSLCVSAISQNWEAFKIMFEGDSKASRKRQMIFMAKTMDLEPEAKSQLLGEAEGLGKVSTLDMKRVAGLGPLEKQYLLYQLVSSNASHCSADSLRSQVIVSDDKSGWNGFRFAPSSKEAVDAVLWTACHAVLPVALGYAEIVEDKNGQAAMTERIHQFHALPSQQLEMIKSFRENV